MSYIEMQHSVLVAVSLKSNMMLADKIDSGLTRRSVRFCYRHTMLIPRQIYGS